MRKAWENTKSVAVVVAVLALVHVINVALDGQLNRFGIIPRSTAHWYHIFFAPFLHGSWQHLLNNIIGLVVFSIFFLGRPKGFFLNASLAIIVMTGVLVWCFARSAVHIGASGWVFGLWGLAISMGFFDRRPSSIFISIVVAMLYGGMIFGVLPANSRISFEAHLFGALSGVFLAFWVSRKPKINRKRN